MTSKSGGSPPWCKAPDRREPRLVCGYPLPCPDHQVIVIWPEDLAFKTLAYAIRDGVTVAINSGFTVTRARAPNCCCPLGATLLDLGREAASHPGADYFLTRLARRVPLWDTETVLPDEQMVWAFVAGFEEGRVSTSMVAAVEASGRLGLWYRRKFLGQGEARHNELTRRQRLSRGLGSQGGDP